MLTLSLGPAEGGKDTCQGDSGGPLVARATGVDDGYSLIGVVSWGYGCAVPGLYGVYAEFSHYLGWVKEQFGVNGSGPSSSPTPVSAPAPPPYTAPAPTPAPAPASTSSPGLIF